MDFDTWLATNPAEPKREDYCQHDELIWDCSDCVDLRDDAMDWCSDDEERIKR